MRGEGDKDKHDRDEEASGHPCHSLTDGVEFDPAEDGDLHEEHEDSEHGGEAPGELHDQVHLHVWRLEHSLLCLERNGRRCSKYRHFIRVLPRLFLT